MLAFFSICSSPYIFQAAIPPADVAVIDACLDLIESEPEIIESLWEKTHYLREKLIGLGFDVGHSESPIVPVFIRDVDILRKMEKELFEHGIFTIAVQYPAVKTFEVRFRFIVNNSHTKKEIDNLIKVLSKLGQRHGLIRKNTRIKKTRKKNTTKKDKSVNKRATKEKVLINNTIVTDNLRKKCYMK